MKQRLLPYWLIAPAALFTVALFVVPFYGVASLAFGGAQGEFSLAAFKTMTEHWKFAPALKNTLWLAALVIPLQLMMALAMAQMLNQIRKGRDLLLYVWTVPLGISDLAAGIIWLAIFEQTGFLNSFLVTAGGMAEPYNFLAFQNTGSMLVAVVLAEVWRATAIVLVILVSGMGLIPKEYGEAADVFGASAWQKFWHVTLPLLKPSLQTALILRTILAFEVFAVVAALSGTKFPVLMSETYNWQFNLQDGPVAAAMAMVILGISIVSTLIYLRVLRTPKGVTA
ncbi:MAG: carbohydrate ABC transporter permease [Limnohabitans sp.]|jgi:multiple sugar transport system permease protein